jgi:endo-1,4-beta-xylanase
VTPLPTASFPTPIPYFPSCQPQPGVAPFQVSEQLVSPIITPPPGGMRDLANQRGIYIGAAINPGYIKDAQYNKILASNFNILVPDGAMKWMYVHPEPDVYDFKDGDMVVSYARQQGMQLRGHVLVWEGQLPQWITEATFTRDEWTKILCTHIKTVVGHYRGQIYAWDVVNEAVNTDGTLYNNFWLQRIGPDYIPMAFQWAREADSNALLFYNDNGGEGINPKSQGIYSLILGMKSKGIPVDGVGLQMHTWLYGSPSPEKLKANIERLAALGLEVHITEIDVRIQNSAASNQIRLQEQAAIYRQIFQTCLEEKSCKAFLTWGVSDKYSWIKWLTNHEDAPLLFDDNGQPKPAYWAIMDVLATPGS